MFEPLYYEGSKNMRDFPGEFVVEQHGEDEDRKWRVNHVVSEYTQWGGRETKKLGIVCGCGDYMTAEVVAAALTEYFNKDEIYKEELHRTLTDFDERIRRLEDPRRNRT